MTTATLEAESPMATGGEPASPSLAASFAHCHAVTRQQAKNFYYGMRLTPEPKRSALYAVYAFMRACDDLVDQPVDREGGEVQAETDAAAVAIRRRRVEAFRAELDQVLRGGPMPPGMMWPAFAHVVHTYPVEGKHLHAMLDGQLADLEPTAYRTFDELYDYCYKVASVVGLVCVSVWGDDGDPAVPELAEHRGIALQLTNVLRDVKEDALRGRVYLPREDLDRFGVDPATLRGEGGSPPAAFVDLMNFELDRARAYYRKSAGLESHLDPACRATCWAMMRIYRRLLDKIAADPTRVLRQRVSLSPPRKAYLAARATWKRTWRS
ncbi:MAG: phytoene/squalene synthase family protein [Phycisphaeraceae bacterium]